ncbi:MAG: hypothetical protein GX434_08540 [Peptococcaceae bacterium]|nr:hypothetical protein [Peptococcaceae bacterium]
MKKNVLLFCAVPTQFQELFLLAQLLKKCDIYNPIFVFDEEQDNKVCYKKCNTENIDCVSSKNWETLAYNKDHRMVDDKSKINYNLSNIKRLSWLKRQVKNIIPSVFKNYYRFFRANVEEYRRVTKFISTNRIVDFYDPAVIFVPIETVGYFFDPVFSYAKQRGIPIIDIPFCFVKAESTVKWFYDLPADIFYHFDANRVLNKLLLKKFPKWIYEYKGKRIMRANIGWILASHRYNIEREYPWIDNLGSSKIVVVESHHFFQLFKKEGIPENKLRIVGSLQHDTMYRLLQNREKERLSLCEELSLSYSEEIKIILVSLPDEFDFSNRTECEFRTHREIIGALVSPLNCYKNIRTVYTLHPRLRYEGVKYLENDCSKVSLRPICELLPCSDLFISITSSAIRLAISCSVPVINYDVFQYKDEDYEDLGGIICVNSLQDFVNAVKQVLDNERYLSQLKLQQEESSMEWGKPDGLVAERYMSIIKEV